METVEEARNTIHKELTSDDVEVRTEYLKHFEADVQKFSETMARAFVNWRSLDTNLQGNEKRAYVSALTFTVITLHILSMKLFISGCAVAAGNLFRQVTETVALALLCSGTGLNVLERFMERKYSTDKSVRDVIRHAKKLEINKEALEVLREAQQFYHGYSHPSELTIGSMISFSQKASYVGAAFDEGKLKSYRKEINLRVGLAEHFSNFVDAVKANVAKL
jgi:hypothetical protein